MDGDERTSGATAAHAAGTCCGACEFAAEQEHSGTPPGAPITVPLDATGVPRGLVVVARPRRAERDAEAFDVTTPQVRIGRVPGNEIVLRDLAIAKRQATLVFEEGRVLVVDGRGGCGTYVNGKKISEPRALCEGDQIRIGNFILELVVIPT